MPNFQTDVLDVMARIIGGTVSAVNPTFFSGPLANAGAGDGTGITGLTGCYSAAPDSLQSFPVAIVLGDKFTAELASEGEEDNVDNVRVLLLIAPFVSESQTVLLTPYRDSVPVAFRARMQGFTGPNAMDFFVTSGQQGVYSWAAGAEQYIGWEFIVRVRRMLAVQYVGL